MYKCKNVKGEIHFPKIYTFSFEHFHMKKINLYIYILYFYEGYDLNFLKNNLKVITFFSNVFIFVKEGKLWSYHVLRVVLG